MAGAGPQLNVMTPPAATAAMNASLVQLAGVPVPTTVRGLATLSGCASAGTAQLPFGLPAAGPVSGFVGGSPLLVLPLLVPLPLEPLVPLAPLDDAPLDDAPLDDDGSPLLPLLLAPELGFSSSDEQAGPAKAVIAMSRAAAPVA